MLALWGYEDRGEITAVHRRKGRGTPGDAQPAGGVVAAEDEGLPGVQRADHPADDGFGGAAGAEVSSEANKAVTWRHQ